MDINWQPATLSNETLSLIPLKTDDFEVLYRVASDPNIWEQHPERDRYRREIFQKFFDEAIVSKTAFLITRHPTGEVIGSTRFYDYKEIERSVAIGYTFLATKYWGGKTNQTVKKLMIDYAFAYVDKIFFHVGITNIRSQTAVKRLGATLDKEIVFGSYGNEISHYQFVLEKDVWVRGGVA